MARNSGDDQHKFQRIADSLIAAIEAGEYRPGDRLPGENVLAKDFGVAVMTARAALRVLRNQGLAEARRGAGVFVRDFRPIRRRAIPRLSRDQWGAGKSIWSADEERPLTVDQVSIEEVVPPLHVLAKLGLEDDEVVLARSRRYVLDERPVMLATSYLPLALVAGSPIVQADTGPGGIYARLADLGHAPVRYQEEIRGRLPTSDEATALKMAPERSVLQVLRTAFDAHRAVVEVNDMTLDSAAYVMEYEFEA
ncbi:GntR family transcriptional regulator [Embleya sp. NBC_00896]|uniref:GntR family transcriptional regulator n=1 Tax=Embleya sp. NBC_00896 TaxID=2975961 RepID=UPI002F90BE8B|nr:GntR family transcriptional regulator [Embleya sp. NBC_00896]